MKIADEVPAVYRNMDLFERTELPSQDIIMNWKGLEVMGLPEWTTLDDTFSGCIEYQLSYEWDGDKVDVWLDLGEVFEIAEFGSAESYKGKRRTAWPGMYL